MKPQYRIALIYLIVGILWIFLSDVATNSFFNQKEDIAIAQNIKGWLFITITAILLFFLIQRDIYHITNSYHQTISGWVKVMDLRHKETKNHSIRVTNMALELAKLSGISDKKKLEDIKRGAILHDIGKIGIPDAILIKPGSLDAKEWEIMKKHPQIAHDLLMKIDFLSPSIAIPYCHHEKWDGSGYPQGLKADAIPIEARIFAVVDVWDALIHPRVYKAAWSEDEVLHHIQEQSGKHFDPAIAKLFIENYDAIKSRAKVGDFITSPV